MPDPTDPNPECSQTQCNRIIAYLRAGNSITGLAALNLFGVIHLPRRILDIKERGFSLADEWIKVGEKRVKRYWLLREPSEVSLT
jgi:hypothetical protein